LTLAAQIFLNSTVASDASLTEATGARAEHPLVTRRISARQQAGVQPAPPLDNIRYKDK